MRPSSSELHKDLAVRLAAIWVNIVMQGLDLSARPQVQKYMQCLFDRHHDFSMLHEHHRALPPKRTMRVFVSLVNTSTVPQIQPHWSKTTSSTQNNLLIITYYKLCIVYSPKRPFYILPSTRTSDTQTLTQNTYHYILNHKIILNTHTFATWLIPDFPMAPSPALSVEPRFLPCNPTPSAMHVWPRASSS